MVVGEGEIVADGEDVKAGPLAAAKTVNLRLIVSQIPVV